MMACLRRLAVAAAAALWAFALTPLAQASASSAPAPSSPLTPGAQRVSDESIYRDHQQYIQLQQRIKSLNDGGRRVADYHLAKAQCWLDVSFHEYTRNDRSSFPQSAMRESEKLVEGMELKRTFAQLGVETPLVAGAVRVRSDLWGQLDKLKQHQGFACAAQKIACAEVELVHAGNEFGQQGWRHANPYVQIAEDLTREALGLVETCSANAPVVTPVPPPPIAKAPVVAPATVPVRAPKLLTAIVFFNFDKRDAADIRAASLASLELAVTEALSTDFNVQTVRVTGHADRLNATGNAGYNTKLAQDRAAAVREILIKRGIPAGAITVDSKAAAQQVASCDATSLAGASLQECLAPNRRVEVQISLLPK
jgi:outer membrane protein OmpA-like peptidoglycan-associated protein